MTPEGKVKAEIKKYLDSLGEDCWYFMPMMMGYGRKGIPDIVGCIGGSFFGIEVKAPGKGNGLTNWQLLELQSIADAGGLSFSCCSSEVAIALLKRI